MSYLKPRITIVNHFNTHDAAEYEEALRALEAVARRAKHAQLFIDSRSLPSELKIVIKACNAWISAMDVSRKY